MKTVAAGIFAVSCLAVSGGYSQQAKDAIPILSTDLSMPALVTIVKRDDTVTVRSQSHSPAADFVHVRNLTGRLTEIANEVTVEYVDGALPDGNRLQSIRASAAVEAATAIVGERHHLRVATSAKKAVAALNARPDVRYAYPVLYDLGGLLRILLTDRLIVCLASADVTIESINDQYGTETVGPLIGNQWVVRLRAPKTDYPIDVAETVAADPNVAWAEPDFIQQREKHAAPNDPLFINQWHLHSTGQTIGGKSPAVDNDVDAPEAWNLTSGSANTVIAIADDGVQTAHPDLAANIHPSGYDFYDNDSDPNPSHVDDRHGTACAGLAGAVGNNGVGVAGVAYGCKILPIKIVKGDYFVSDSTIASAIQYAAQYADVISCSWGGGLPSTTIQTAIRNARQDGAGGKGSIVLFASGNSGGFRGFQLSGLSATTYTFKWKYVKNSSVSEGEDTCWLDSVTFPGGVTENFDSVTPPALPAGWSGSWTSLNADSVHPAQSGNRFVKANPVSHSQTTYLTRTLTLSSSGSLAYYMRVNCEDNSSSVWQDYAALEISGNTYLRTAGTVAYPSAYDSAVSIGACNSQATKSEYSQYGPQLDFVAPSSGNSAQLGIETTDRTGTAGYNTSSGTAGDYCKAGDSTGFGGTSASTPLAAGIAALVRSIKPEFSPVQIRNILRETANKIDTGGVSYLGRQNGRNDFYGWGRVNAYAAVQSAQASHDILTLANDLIITEVTDRPAAIAFIEIYNQSTTATYSLNNLALTDNEAGNDTAEGSCRFPEGYTIPPRGMAVIIVGTGATQAFADEITANASGPNAPAGGVQVFEAVNSGLSFQGSPIPDMDVLGTARPSLSTSDNVMLVVSDGKEITFLSEVIDGVAWGSPTLSSGCAFGVAPRLAETGSYASSVASDNDSLQRATDHDSNNSSQDFQVLPRTHGARCGVQQVTTPIFNPDGGAHVGSSVTVTVSCATPGVTIRYTTNGSEPTESSPIVASGGTVLVPVPGTLKAKAFKSGMNPSATKSASYTAAGAVATSTFTPDGGAHPGSSVNVAVSCATAGATIRYTTNGSEPTESSPAVESGGTVAVPIPGTLTAKAWKGGLNPSAVKSARYTVANAVVAPAAADFDGDGLADPAVYDERTGSWTV
ncbi:MAG: S8 family serine peptidase, partial [Lentisphaerae bacterium]|nr:S8 family serine peptidase [Lentisphaerota bacterium]